MGGRRVVGVKTADGKGDDRGLGGVKEGEKRKTHGTTRQKKKSGEIQSVTPCEASPSLGFRSCLSFSSSATASQRVIQSFKSRTAINYSAGDLVFRPHVAEFVITPTASQGRVRYQKAAACQDNSPAPALANFFIFF